MQGGVLTAADVGGGASDVADPAVRVVILGTIGNAEVLNLEVGDVVHRDLESERDGADLAACLRGAAGAEANTCTKRVLFATRKLAYRPNERALCRIIVGGCANTGRIRRRNISRSRAFDRDNDIRAMIVSRKVRTDNDDDLEHVRRVLNLFDVRLNAKRCADITRGPIVENNELAVRGNEREDARLLKIVEANACVEVAVVEEDSADSSAGANDEIFVERKCKLRVTWM